MYGLAPTNFIMAVNGKPTLDLESFVRETNKIEDNTYMRLTLMTFDSVKWVCTCKANKHWFPTIDMVKDPSVREGWRSNNLDDDKKKGADFPPMEDAGMEDADGCASGGE
jgi:hypothetical protein